MTKIVFNKTIFGPFNENADFDKNGIWWHGTKKEREREETKKEREKRTLKKK